MMSAIHRHTSQLPGMASLPCIHQHYTTAYVSYLQTAQHSSVEYQEHQPDLGKHRQLVWMRNTCFPSNSQTMTTSIHVPHVMFELLLSLSSLTITMSCVALTITHSYCMLQIHHHHYYNHPFTTLTKSKIL